MGANNIISIGKLQLPITLIIIFVGILIAGLISERIAQKKG